MRRRNPAGSRALRRPDPRQLALAFVVVEDDAPDDDEPDDDEEPDEEDEPLDVPLPDAALSPDDLVSLELLLSELSDVEAGELALALLSSEPLLEAAPGLP